MSEAPPPWIPYRVGTPGMNTCKEMPTIAHVTHLEPALTILQEGVLHSALVAEGERLGDRRLPVIWFSPNVWNGGSRYGTIAFALDWPTLLSGRRAYWVDTMQYKNSACRILLTNRREDDLLLHGLLPYDPRNSDGPWRYDEAAQQHWFNETVVLQLMVDGNIPLSSCKEIQFVNHHSDQCHRFPQDPHPCPELGRRSDEAGSRFIATIVSRNITVPTGLLTVQNGDCIDPNPALQSACSNLMNVLGTTPEPIAQITTAHNQAQPLARAILAAYARDPSSDDGHQLRAFFASPRDGALSCADVIATAFGITNATTLHQPKWNFNAARR